MGGSERYPELPIPVMAFAAHHFNGTIGGDAIDQAMGIINPTRPAALQVSPQRLRFTYALEGVAQDRLQQIMDPDEP